MPDIPGLRFQAVHWDDVADAFLRAVAGDLRGPLNVAADPVLDPATLAGAFGARRIAVPPRGRLDMALAVPIMDTARARGELGWRPARDSVAALRDLLQGMSDGSGADTPPLSPATSGVARRREIAGRIGGRELR